MNRRTFVHAISASVAGAALGSRAEAARVVWPSDQLRLGVIGVGSRGRSVMQRFLRVPGVEITALCDVYPPRFAEGRETTGKDTPSYTDYRRMLDAKAAELDAVLVASPLKYHTDHVVAALESGLHVYGEKVMAYDVAGLRKIVETKKRTGRVYMVGYQRRYAHWTRQAIERVKAGEIGEVTHVFGYWHRNNNWRRALPTEPVPGFNAEQLERLINWRLYREYSRGLIAELGSHQMDLTNLIFGAYPEAVVGSGAVTVYHDGRETFDNVQATFEYPGGKRLFFSSMLNNHKLGYQITALGTGGSLEITLEDATFYYEPERANSAVPKNRPAAIDSLVQKGVDTGPSLGSRGDMPYRGKGFVVQADKTASDQLAVNDFVESIRLSKRPYADERVGVSSAIPIIYGDMATRAGGRIEFSKELTAVRALVDE